MNLLMFFTSLPFQVLSLFAKVFLPLEFGWLGQFSMYFPPVSMLGSNDSYLVTVLVNSELVYMISTLFFLATNPRQIRWMLIAALVCSVNSDDTLFWASLRLTID